MSGWNLKYGQLNISDISEDEYWLLFDFVFSDNSRNRNTYKYGFLKAVVEFLMH